MAQKKAACAMDDTAARMTFETTYPPVFSTEIVQTVRKTRWYRWGSHEPMVWRRRGLSAEK